MTYKRKKKQEKEKKKKQTNQTRQMLIELQGKWIRVYWHHKISHVHK